MLKQFNPYNALPFFGATIPDAGMDCLLYSPTKRLPMFQIELPDVVVSGDVDAYLEEISTGTTVLIPGIEVFNADNGNCYVTYPGSLLTAAAAEGVYRVRLSSDEVTGEFYSYPLCLSKVFDPQDWEAQISCLPSGADSIFTVNFDYHPGVPTEIEVDYMTGDGWERIGDGLNENPATFSGTLTLAGSAKLRLTSYLHDARYYKVFSFSFDPEDPDPCSTVDVVFSHDGGEGYERFLCLEWQNIKDLQSLGIMYSGVQGQDGFLQQFFFEGYASLAGVVAEETFLKNGQGVSVLDSIEIARLYNIQFYPLPDAVLAPLRAANAHTVRQLRQTADTWIAPITSINVTGEEVGGTPCAKGTLSVELNRAMVGCQDNVSEIT